MSWVPPGRVGRALVVALALLLLNLLLLDLPLLNLHGLVGSTPAPAGAGGAPSSITAYDTATGDDVWTRDVPVGRGIQPVVETESTVVAWTYECLAGDAGRGRASNTVVGIDATTGRTRWRIDDAGPADAFWPPRGGQLPMWVRGTRAGVVPLLRRSGREVIAVDVRRGTAQWERRLRSDERAVALDDRHLYTDLPSADGRATVAALALRTGERDWSTTVDPAGTFVDLVANAEQVYVSYRLSTADGGGAQLVALTRDEGVETAVVDLPGQHFAESLIGLSATDHVVVVSQPDATRAFDVALTELVWESRDLLTARVVPAARPTALGTERVEARPGVLALNGVVVDPESGEARWSLPAGWFALGNDRTALVMRPSSDVGVQPSTVPVRAASLVDGTTIWERDLPSGPGIVTPRGLFVSSTCPYSLAD